MGMSRDSVFGKVKEVLVEALGVDEDEITEEATLQGDLDAESIDFLDIVFRLEKTFSIKIPRGELFPDEILSNADYVEDGALTPAGLATLMEAMPHADFTDFRNNPEIAKMPDLFTVRTLINYVEAKLSSGSAAATA